MQINSTSITNGYLDDKFGHRGTEVIKGTSVASRSFHLAWSDLPPNTQSLAMIFIDHDAIPLCGFSWVHWTVANIDPKLGELPENASVDCALLEGVTSWNAPLAPEEWQLSRDDAIGYGGCAPPDKDHRYLIKVYALNKKLDLQNGFYTNELLNAMEGHILDKVVVPAYYRAKQ